MENYLRQNLLWNLLIGLELGVIAASALFVGFVLIHVYWVSLNVPFIQ